VEFYGDGAQQPLEVPVKVIPSFPGSGLARRLNMRVFSILWLALGYSLLAHAQGFVAFENRNSLAGIDASVFDVDCRTRLAGPAYLAQLYFGDTPSSLAPVGTVLPFRSRAGAGYIPNTPVSIPGHPRGSLVWVQIRAWEAAAGPNYEAAVATGGKYGFSNPVAVVLASETTTPTSPVGLQSFCLVPEPGPAALLALGGGLWLLAARRRVESNHL
jgi:hypothetical protein